VHSNTIPKLSSPNLSPIVQLWFVVSLVITRPLVECLLTETS